MAKSPLSIFTLFRRQQRETASAPGVQTPQPAPGLLVPVSAAELLQTPRRRVLLQNIWQRTSLSREQFAQLYREPFERYASLVQQFPASESHHHAYLGGMLDHGLEIVAYATKLRQSHLLPAGAPPETQAAQTEAWTAAVAYAALLHDVGKVAVDLYVEDDTGAAWHPWHAPLSRPYHFRYRKEREYRLHNAAIGLLCMRILDARILDWLSSYPELWSALLYALAGQHERAGVLSEIVIQADRASVAQSLGGDPSSAQRAPRQSLQRQLLEGLRHLLKDELKLNQPSASDGWLTQDALWLVSKTVCDKLRAYLLSHGIEGVPTRNSTLFDVLQEYGIVQAAPDGNAIWRATVASDTGWSHTFTFLQVSPALIWDADARPASFSGTVRAETARPEPAPTTPLPSADNSPAGNPSPVHEPDAGPPVARADPVASLLELLNADDTSRAEQTAPIDAGPAAPPVPADVSSPTAPGTEFLTWLRERVSSRGLLINDARALVHTVSGTVFLVSPGIFRRYIQERPDVAQRARRENPREWEWVQKHFERLKIHRKLNSGLNIWTCDVVGPRRTRRLHGYLLASGEHVFTDMPPDNPHLKLAVLDGPADHST